jgi:hypothetical protein
MFYAYAYNEYHKLSNVQGGRFDPVQFSPNIYGTFKDLLRRFPAFLKGPSYGMLMAYSLLRAHPLPGKKLFCRGQPVIYQQCQQIIFSISSTMADRSKIQRVIYRFLQIFDSIKLPITMYDAAQCQKLKMADLKSEELFISMTSSRVPVVPLGGATTDFINK